MKIHQRYIDEAHNIREEYLKNIEIIATQEEKIEEYKTIINNCLENNNSYISKNKNKTIDVVKEELRDNLAEIDKYISIIVNKLNPIFENIKQLEKKSSELFKTIKEKYPNITDAEIQKIIFYSIEK